MLTWLITSANDRSRCVCLVNMRSPHVVRPDDGRQRTSADRANQSTTYSCGVNVVGAATNVRVVFRTIRTILSESISYN